MSFSSDVKDELARIQLASRAEKKAVLIGITCAIGGIALRRGRGISVKLTTESVALVKLASSVAPSVYDVSADTIQSRGSFGKSTASTSLYLSGKGASALLYDCAILTENNDTSAVNVVDNMSESELRLFLRGAFLACGVVTNPNKSYRFELVTKTHECCALFIHAAERCSLVLKESERNGSFVAYTKDSSTLSALLVTIGATEAMMAVESILVERTVTNDTNRATNCMLANIDKSVNAASAQCRAIRFLFSRGIALTEPLMTTAHARLENPDATLSELACILGIGKSGTNHRLVKLVQLAESFGMEE